MNTLEYIGELCYSSHPYCSMCTYTLVTLRCVDGAWHATSAGIPELNVVGKLFTDVIADVPKAVDRLCAIKGWNACAQWVPPNVSMI